MGREIRRLAKIFVTHDLEVKPLPEISHVKYFTIQFLLLTLHTHSLTHINIYTSITSMYGPAVMDTDLTMPLLHLLRINMECHPSGHCWDYYPGDPSHPIFKWIEAEKMWTPFRRRHFRGHCVLNGFRLKDH